MQADAIRSHSDAAARVPARSETLAAAVMTAMLGALIIWGVGFSPIAALHNAAHDTRHSIALPCH